MRKFFTLLAVLLSVSSFAHEIESDDIYFMRIKAKTKAERTALAEAGIAIEGVLSDSVITYGNAELRNKYKKAGRLLEARLIPQGNPFPGSDAAFHDYAELNAELDKLEKNYPSIAKKISIGSSLEGREMAGIRLSSESRNDSLPTAIFMGCHHAREHLSVEVPLKLAQYLAENYAKDARIKKLLDTREVWIVPMVNPDGAEYDIASGKYRSWRKNRAKNRGGTRGVDLNRNYGKSWGGPGSSGNPSSDTYRGPKAFSEPETQAVRDFVRSRKRTTTLLTFHTYSELVMWPWGYTDDEISVAEDRKVFETMGRKMATWNHYTPQKASELYLASGDTTDWAYDELKIFAFTFELSPNSLSRGGFYPGARAIEPTFKANLEPSLYLIENAEDPYKLVRPSPDPLGFLN